MPKTSSLYGYLAAILVVVLCVLFAYSCAVFAR